MAADCGANSICWIWNVKMRCKARFIAPCSRRRLLKKSDGARTSSPQDLSTQRALRAEMPALLLEKQFLRLNRQARLPVRKICRLDELCGQRYPRSCSKSSFLNFSTDSSSRPPSHGGPDAHAPTNVCKGFSPEFQWLLLRHPRAGFPHRALRLVVGLARLKPPV
jgi:hypothetical protein